MMTDHPSLHTTFSCSFSNFNLPSTESRYEVSPSQAEPAKYLQCLHQWRECRPLEHPWRPVVNCTCRGWGSGAREPFFFRHFTHQNSVQAKFKVLNKLFNATLSEWIFLHHKTVCKSCCMAWAGLERLRFLWHSLRICQATNYYLVLAINSSPAFPIFSGLMHLPLVQSHRDWRESVTFLRLSLLHWTVHLNLLYGGSALWEITMQWSLIMLITWHLMNWSNIFHLG